jgi:hypothetical protein
LPVLLNDPIHKISVQVICRKQVSAQGWDDDQIGVNIVGDGSIWSDGNETTFDGNLLLLTNDLNVKIILFESLIVKHVHFFQNCARIYDRSVVCIFERQDRHVFFLHGVNL